MVSFDTMPSVCFCFLCLKKINLKLAWSCHNIAFVPDLNHVLFSIDQNSNVETRQFERTNRKLAVYEPKYVRFFKQDLMISFAIVEQFSLNSEMKWGKHFKGKCLLGYKGGGRVLSEFTLLQDEKVFSSWSALIILFFHYIVLGNF